MHTFFLQCCRVNSSRIDITRMPWGPACANRENRREGTGASSLAFRIANPLPTDGSLLDPDPQRLKLVLRASASTFALPWGFGLAGTKRQPHRAVPGSKHCV
jgi:hypothetical protein